jgi:hypothetical protein
VIGDEHEITFQEYYDFQARARHPGAAKKIANACEKAKSHGSKYIWIDSCCIDKSSSNEFSEAINSMFKWYQNSERCYVYLSDFQSGLTESRARNPVPITATQISNFQSCRWFERGWTLQELLAPKNEIFYDCNWIFFGPVAELAPILSTATRIPQQVLNGTTPLYHYTIAQKMSWAATRRTTREEDMAYSLFGLFNVNLPLFYGEGANKAFFRLQEAIMKESNDLTLFAWQSEHELCFRGILLPISENPEFTMTNKGLKIETMLCQSASSKFMPLNCTATSDSTLTARGIRLVEHSGMMVRECPDDLFRPEISNDALWIRESIYIAKDVRIPRIKDTVGYPTTNLSARNKVSASTEEFLARSRSGSRQQ